MGLTWGQSQSWTKGQKFPHSPGIKGHWDKLKILPQKWQRWNFDILLWDGTGLDFDNLS